MGQGCKTCEGDYAELSIVWSVAGDGWRICAATFDLMLRPNRLLGRRADLLLALGARAAHSGLGGSSTRNPKCFPGYRKARGVVDVRPGTRPNAGVSPPAGEERTPRRAQRMSRAKSGTAKVEMARPLETRSKHCTSNPEGTPGLRY